MKAYTYISEGNFELREKEKPVIMHERDPLLRLLLQAFAQAIYTLNTAVFPVPFPA